MKYVYLAILSLLFFYASTFYLGYEMGRLHQMTWVNQQIGGIK